MEATGRGTADAAQAGGAHARVRLLGGAELEGQPPLRFLPERRFRLLAYLALRADWVSRDELAALFWPDRTQEAARSNLRKLLLEVRALGLAAARDRQRTGMRWQVATDVAEFGAAIAQGDLDAAAALHRRGARCTASTAARAKRSPSGSPASACACTLPGAMPWSLPCRAATPPVRWCSPGCCSPTTRSTRTRWSPPSTRSTRSATGAAPPTRSARYAERLIEELGVEPSARVRSAAAGGRDTAPTDTRAAAHAPRDTPAAATPALTALSFIGRERELQELAALLGGGPGRLVTVTGPGGIGKSRLVKQALRELAARYADGVTWIALDDLADVAQVPPRMAAELALAPDPADDALAVHRPPFRDAPGPARARQRRAPARAGGARRSAARRGAAPADRRDLALAPRQRRRMAAAAGRPGAAAARRRLAARR